MEVNKDTNEHEAFFAALSSVCCVSKLILCVFGSNSE